jgi:hypothetical protein
VFDFKQFNGLKLGIVLLFKYGCMGKPIFLVEDKLLKKRVFEELPVARP